MNKVTVWNRESTNYDQNEFVRQNGTISFEIESESEAMRLVTEAINNSEIDRVDIELEDGVIIWVRYSCKNSKCDEDKECSDRCDCCWDDEDSDLNDSRL